MQPYFLPYLGYWQLIRAVDRFVIYDDVNYIVRGWVNRNRIPINGEPHYLTLPVRQASQHARICDTRLQTTGNWRGKMLKTVENTYRRAPFFAEVFPAVARIVGHETDSLADFLLHQINLVSALLGNGTEIVASSRRYGNADLTGQQRILDICRIEGADQYINAIGGRELYAMESFRSAGIELRFLRMRPMPYAQRTQTFMPYLSILDVLMEVGPRDIAEYLDAYDLLTGDDCHVAAG